MEKYIDRRLLWVIFIVVGAAFVIFTIPYFTPGDPAIVITGGNAKAEDVESLHRMMGLDQPYSVQLKEFLYHTFFKLDLGTSWVYGKPVLDELLTKLPRTLIIGLTVVALNFTIGLLMGIFAATHEGKRSDSLAVEIAMISISCPDFWVALMMILPFSSRLDWLPSYGIGGPQHYIMPILCGVLGGIVVNVRQIHADILGVSREDYIITARAKGQKERRAVPGHMLPNALMPIITSIGNGFAHAVAGSATIRNIFSAPGVGLYLLVVINGRDYPAVYACILFFAIFTVVAMLIVDLVYTFVDPRVRTQYSHAKKGTKHGK